MLPPSTSRSPDWAQERYARATKLRSAAVTTAVFAAMAAASEAGYASMEQKDLSGGAINAVEIELGVAAASLVVARTASVYRQFRLGPYLPNNGRPEQVGLDIFDPND